MRARVLSWAVGMVGLLGLGVLRVDALPAPDLRSAAAVQLRPAPGADPVSLNTWQAGNTPFVVLKTAVEALGGQLQWTPETRTVLVRTSRHSLRLTVGLPRGVADEQRLVRLPHLLYLYRGRVLISLPSLQFIWPLLSGQTLQFDANQRVLGTPAALATAAGKPQPPASPKGLVVVVDAGHGGKDPGAIGPGRLEEKGVTLSVAKRLQTLLSGQGYSVIMTRGDDRFIPLKERAEIANRAKADLFISIHANASLNRQACGSQVFIYNREASSTKAAETARLENQDANYLEIIKDDLRQGIHEKSSVTAGGLVGERIKQVGLETHPLERAPFYVLAKSDMPSILVETAFISNPKEENKLRQADFCGNLANLIAAAVEQYFKEKGRRPS